MKLGLQFGAWFCGLALGAGLLLPCAAAQRPKDSPPPREQSRPPQANRPPQRDNPPAQRPPAPRDNRATQGNDRGGGSYHPQNAPSRNERPAYQDRRPSNDNRKGTDNRPRGNDNQPRDGRYQRIPSASPNSNSNRPPDAAIKRFQDLSPEDKRRVLDNRRKFDQLPPQKQQEMRQAAEQWQRMTPEQRQHIQNDVLPRWKQMPPDRQKAIQHRLGVLQNMPEGARNRHLNDPNFTRGMSEEDKQMLRDLSHQHVGAPQEQPLSPNEQ